MTKPNLNILRNLRLQLKTGFLQKEPAAYKFLQRYPPLARDTAPPVRKVVRRNIPYLKYYENAVAKNPLYADEKVYPAYWAHEPQALTLAKKQYELLQNDKTLTEDAAYEQALAHVEHLENESFSRIKAVIADLKGARQPYSANPELGPIIDSWRTKLAATPYVDMPLADQGEIDWIVQTKLLKWHEVERERRMKDPVFVMQFEKLRSAVFPEIGQKSDANRVAEHEEYKSRLLTLYGVSQERLHTAKPFFFEDYAKHFARLKEQPLLVHWEDREREALSHWIVESLALREVLERRTSSTIQRYLDTLRAHFFPMVRYPERAASFALPSAQDLKALLYSNDVGYKSEGGKLYIRRAYRLPKLLFPKETLATALLSSQGDKVPGMLGEKDGSSLLAEMKRVGLDDATLPELQRQLQEYTRGAGTGGAGGREGSMAGRGGAGATGGASRGAEGEMDMSPLDALLRDDDDDVTLRSKAASGQAQERQQAVQGSASTDAASTPSEGARVATGEYLPDLSLNTAASLGKPEWERLVSRYFPTPTTELEQRREELFRSVVLDQPESADDEQDLEYHKRVRTENMLVTRARLSVEYEQKEAARRTREWRSRGVLMETLPRAQLSLVDNRE